MMKIFWHYGSTRAQNRDQAVGEVLEWAKIMKLCIEHWVQDHHGGHQDQGNETEQREVELD